jgi:signal transduction histidine kinase
MSDDLPSDLASAAAPGSRSRLRHDIANPLNALLGFALLLQCGEGGPLPPRALEMVEDIIAAAREVQAIVDAALAPAPSPER